MLHGVSRRTAVEILPAVPGTYFWRIFESSVSENLGAPSFVLPLREGWEGTNPNPTPSSSHDRCVPHLFAFSCERAG